MKHQFRLLIPGDIVIDSSRENHGIIKRITPIPPELPAYPRVLYWIWLNNDSFPTGITKDYKIKK